MSVNKQQMRAIRRLMADLDEIRSSPIDVISAAPLEEDVMEWHCNFRHEDTVFHFILFFPNEYPFKSPRLEFLPPGFQYRGGATRPGKKGVEVCISLFTNYEDLHREWEHEQGHGWSPSYTVQTALVNLLAFLGDMGYVWDNDYNKNLSKDFACPDCGHTHDKPYPPLGGDDTQAEVIDMELASSSGSCDSKLADNDNEGDKENQKGLDDEVIEHEKAMDHNNEQHDVGENEVNKENVEVVHVADKAPVSPELIDNHEAVDKPSTSRDEAVVNVENIDAVEADDNVDDAAEHADNLESNTDDVDVICLEPNEDQINHVVDENDNIGQEDQINHVLDENDNIGQEDSVVMDEGAHSDLQTHNDASLDNDKFEMKKALSFVSNVASSFVLGDHCEPEDVPADHNDLVKDAIISDVNVGAGCSRDGEPMDIDNDDGGRDTPILDEEAEDDVELKLKRVATLLLSSSEGDLGSDEHSSQGVNTQSSINKADNAVMEDNVVGKKISRIDSINDIQQKNMKVRLTYKHTKSRIEMGCLNFESARHKSIICYISKQMLQMVVPESKEDLFGFAFALQTVDDENLLIHSPCEYIMGEQFFAMKEAIGVVHSVAKEKMEFFLPLYTHSTHIHMIKQQFEETMIDFAKKLQALGGEELDMNIKDITLYVVPCLMVNAMEEFVSGTNKGNRDFLKGFFALHRLLLWASDEYPEVQEEIDEELQNFLNDEKCRTMEECPQLDKLLVYLTVSTKYRWADLREVFIMESWRRDVYYYFEGDRKLGDITLAQEDRMTRTFTSMADDYIAQATQVAFVNIACPEGLDREAMKKQYDANFGLPSRIMEQQLRAELKNFADVKDYSQLFEALRMEPTSEEEIFNRLKSCVQYCLENEPYAERDGCCPTGWPKALTIYEKFMNPPKIVAAKGSQKAGPSKKHKAKPDEDDPQWNPKQSPVPRKRAKLEQKDIGKGKVDDGKRGRGRPKQEPLKNVKGRPAAVPVRQGRGRQKANPGKQVEQERRPKAEPAKQGRGRPRVAPAKEDKRPKAEPAKPGRGRPKAEAVVQGRGRPEAPPKAEAVKHGRGRPKAIVAENMKGDVAGGAKRKNNVGRKKGKGKALAAVPPIPNAKVKANDPEEKFKERNIRAINEIPEPRRNAKGKVLPIPKGKGKAPVARKANVNAKNEIVQKVNIPLKKGRKPEHAEQIGRVLRKR